ncbi:ABC transporter permease [Ectobacillus antri]|uniref:ABC transporter permease n=1 Tax=Ectobacillus antri TaxID=2486280 RepID=A0ABT6H946_9BACI|nr:ABC transporter permease [Ectobacillus antri]MDG4658167.1 ABC transporter permease [Ectobacillus antri]MDG5755239.1 ABC transporter permease [Ectobacillus antri]
MAVTIHTKLSKKPAIKQGLYQFGTIGIILAVTAFFALMNESFLTYQNISDILRSISIVTLLAIGVTFTLVVDGFDLSVGATASLATVTSAAALVLYRQELLVALLIPLLCGLLVGLLNAFLVVRIKLPDLLATLSVMYIISGLQLTLTKGSSIYEGMAGATGRFIPSFLFIGQGSVLGIPVPVVIMLLVSAIAYVFLEKTTYGRMFYMTGSNREAARLAGIPTNRYRLYAYGISGLFAALGGIVLTSRIGTGQVSAGGPLLMDAVAAAYIGYAIFGAKKPNIIGTVLGSVLIGIILNGLTMMNVPYYAQDIIKGSILVAALAFSFASKK